MLISLIALMVFSGGLPMSGFAASKEKVLHTFGRHRDGIDPEASLISDKSGNLYGTTVFGGEVACGYDTGCGSVFQLVPTGRGEWKENLLHRFGDQDGGGPVGSLIFDGAGNLYGTVSGGRYDSLGNGNVFELSPQADGEWAFAVLYSFRGGNDGGSPFGGVIFDSGGNLYGTTLFGGAYGSGTVFELERKGNGEWEKTVLHSFKDDGKDGTAPWAGLILDRNGNLYGTTSSGGAYGSVCMYGCGTVFELTSTDGKWAERILHSFNGKDGSSPVASLTMDAKGNLYSTTEVGGVHNDGTVFELSLSSNSSWKEKILHSFNGTDGESPFSNVIFDAAGNLYGTTLMGGSYRSNCNRNCGTVFEVSPDVHGKWREKLLHSFNGDDGKYPSGGLLFDAAGNLYGDTSGDDYGSNCGGSECGTVFEISRQSALQR
jgi:uncharacterized repeat protein (TIGR03803 family)